MSADFDPTHSYPGQPASPHGKKLQPGSAAFVAASDKITRTAQRELEFRAAQRVESQDDIIDVLAKMGISPSEVVDASVTVRKLVDDDDA